MLTCSCWWPRFFLLLAKLFLLAAQFFLLLTERLHRLIHVLNLTDDCLIVDVVGLAAAGEPQKIPVRHLARLREIFLTAVHPVP